VGGGEFMHHTKITQKERELISQWKKEAVANKEIARRLSRPVLTIRRELKRNQTRVSVGKNWEVIYEPVHAQSVAMERKILFALSHINNSSGTSLFYAILAENYLSKALIDPLIAIFTTGGNDIWELTEEQASYVLQKLAKKYPDFVMQKVTTVLDEVLDKDIDAYYPCLFDLFPFFDKKKCTSWFIETIQKQFELNDIFLRDVMYLGIPETIPHIRKALDNNHWNPDDVNIEELEDNYIKLVQGEFPKNAPPTDLEKRKDWELYYMEIESNALSDEEIAALSRIPFPVYIMDKKARNEECYCGKTDKKGKPLKYKDCCFEREAAIVNLPRFTKETTVN